jgi:hypothetical protein
MAIFALFNPAFPISKTADTLANLKCPTFNVLWGTFGKQFDNADYLIYRITNAGARKTPVKIGIYVDCGPCRRPRRGNGLEHFRPDLTIDQFNALLAKEDAKLLADWDKRLAEVYAFIDRYSNPRLSTYLPWKKVPKIEWLIYPVLEDNLQQQGYNLLKSRISAWFQVTPIRLAIGRNRMGLYSGPEPTEIHSYTPSHVATLSRGDAVNGDGIMSWPRKDLVGQCKAKGIDFLLWDADWQGSAKLPVNQRYYFIDDAQKILRFLQ